MKEQKIKEIVADTNLDLATSIKEAKTRGIVPIIAEVKRLTPKLVTEEGMKKDLRDAGDLTRLYQRGGAIGISLVAEKEHFGGQPETDIPRILTSVDLPLLIKDFITSEAIVETAKKRFERHQKILGGSTYFDKHLYLTLHYAAEYMVLGYLCRKVPVLNRSSFIVNYNSPNVVYFNQGELLAETIRGRPKPKGINSVPVFQVKYY